MCMLWGVEKDLLGLCPEGTQHLMTCFLKYMFSLEKTPISYIDKQEL